MPKTRKIKIDTVRASRDGHEFHEAWAARQSLRLVLQLDDLIGISVESLAVEDQGTAAAETIDIADLVFYYGKSPNFKSAKTVRVIQVKYSINHAADPFKASDATKTVRKFGKTFRKERKNHGAKEVRDKLEFALVTNRPVSADFLGGLSGIVAGKKLKGSEAKQAKQFKAASCLKGKDLKEFAAKFSVVCSTGNLKENKLAAERLIADWSAGRDAIARLRVAELRDLVRNKAGSAGHGKNMIRQIDVIASLGLQSERDILPFPPNFPKVGPIVPREQLLDCIKLIPNLQLPLLIHADGGTGKTVFLESLANSLNKEHLCVCFDCFDGGIYRSPEDGRHRPSRGLTQIANTLACSGLCDPLLPTNENRETLIAAFRARLTQAVETLQRRSKGKKLIILIDAIDNAAIQAKDKNEDCFPKLILESLAISGQIKDVKFVVSCRTHRRKLAKGEIKCDELELRPFSKNETRQFLSFRINKLKESEVVMGQARSRGNPRVLEHLARERGLLESSQHAKPIKLNKLIKDRIESALEEATKRGYQESEINSFLAGLSVLPPPVPVQEYANAHGMDVGAISSFASDLAPLLEQTKYGLTFRDEPTETYIREKHAADKAVLRLLADNLLKNQATSVYAAQALPALLEILDDGQSLFNLAFNDEIPASITSEVGKHKIRYSRLRAAVLHAAREKNYNFLVRLLVELSTVSAINQRGTDYLVDNPELVVLSQDADAARRLIEDRTHWPGTKHARAAIALCLSQDSDEGLRHAIRASEWFQFAYNAKKEHHHEFKGPSKLDIAAVPFCLIAQGRGKDAAGWLGSYYDSYGFTVSEHLFRLLSIAKKIGAFPFKNTENFLDDLGDKVGLIAGALSFFELEKAEQATFVKKLARECKKTNNIENRSHEFSERQEYKLADGLLKSTVLALYSGLRSEATEIAKVIPSGSANVYAFLDRWGTYDACPFVVGAILQCVSQGEPVHFHSVLPSELVKAGSEVPKGLSFAEFTSQLKAAYKNLFEADAKLPKEQRSHSFTHKDEAERFIGERLETLHRLAASFAAIFTDDTSARKKALAAFIEVWEKARSSSGRYHGPEEPHSFFNILGKQLLEFAIWSGAEWERDSVVSIVEKLQDDVRVSEISLIEIVSVLAKRTDLHDIAGKLAVKIKARIETGDDVSSRSTLFGLLAKSMAAASTEEAKEYFGFGLQQMEAIGSGDYEFTNELLGFAASVRGKELDPEDFHTLTNLFELNMTTDSEKLAWYDFARGLTRVSGCRELAKLARWHDRDKAELEFSLLPCLYALIDQDKIEPDLALGIMRLSDAAELYQCNTTNIAHLIEKKRYANQKDLLQELIEQFEANHPNYGIVGMYEELSQIAERVFGAESEITKRLKITAPHFDKVREQQNDRTNYREPDAEGAEIRKQQEEDKKKNLESLQKLAQTTDPCDEQAISTAFDSIGDLQRSFDFKKQFLHLLQNKVPFADRLKHIEAIARLGNAEFHIKLDALKSCKAAWASSSQALKAVFRNIGTTLIEIHSDDLITNEYFSGVKFKEVATLCYLDFKDLTLELIKTFATPESDVPPQVWLEIASILSPRAEEGVGQAALKRLLDGGAAKLSASVADGAYQKNLYPEGDVESIAAEFTWFMLGSPSISDRWRAAHAIRTFARFGRWKVIELVVNQFETCEAGSFQASELKFYFSHARLWLLIALNRLSRDYPQRIAKFRSMLQKIANEGQEPHILLKHFAAKTLLACQAHGKLKLSANELKKLAAATTTHFKTIKIKDQRHSNYYNGRPDSHPEPSDTFRLEYDFDKNQIDGLARLFNVTRWDIHDGITKWVRRYDTAIEAMYDSGGRNTDHQEASNGLNSKRQPYGGQLGWHGLYVTVGQLLKSKPIVIGPYDDEDPWPDWIARQVLTRPDGLWLSDGMDRAPLETQINLFDSVSGGKVTSDDRKLLSLFQLDNVDSKEMVLSGSWESPDGIRVALSSSFVLPSKASEVAGELAKADGFNVWLPSAHDYASLGDEEGHGSKRTFPFLHHPSKEGGIDEFDPLGSLVTMCRPQFTEKINSAMGIKAADPFRRHWVRGDGKVVCHSEAWGTSETNYEGESKSGKRFVCAKDFVSELLAKYQMDMLLLVLLRKYQRGHGSTESEYWHTTALVHVTKEFKQVFYPGLASAKHENKRWT